MPVKEKVNKEQEEMIIIDDSVVDDNKKTKHCFIVTPIGSEDDPIRRHIEGVYNAALSPVLKEFGYESNLPHKILTPGSITRQIIKSIYDSDLIIVNLTNINPNVMYELALTHCFNKPTIIIAVEGTELPFDIINERTIFYVNDPEGVFDLQEDLRKAIKDLPDKEIYKSTVVSYIQEFNFDEKLKSAELSSQNGYSESFKMLFRRLDRIEFGLQRYSNEERIVEIPRSTKTYRIYQDDIPLNKFEEFIKLFIDSCRELGFRVRYRIYKDKFCSVQFLNETLSNSKIIENELDAFCNAFNLKYERIYNESQML